MSIIHITEHDESIYDISQINAPLTKQHVPVRQVKSRSNLSAQSKSSTDIQKLKVSLSDPCKKKPHATMGVAKQELPDPKIFLKKHTGKPPFPICIPPKDPKLELKRPKIDLTPPKFVKEEKSSTNFIEKNIEDAKKMQPKHHEFKVVVDKFGNTEPYTYFVKGKDYGRTPPYLIKFIRIKEKEYQLKKETTGTQQPLCRYITREEREKLLNGLKQNWEELQKKYQGLPILTDTIPKINRKSKLEAELKQLEKDIVLVERHPYIYVYDDEEALASQNHSIKPN